MQKKQKNEHKSLFYCSKICIFQKKAVSLLIYQRLKKEGKMNTTNPIMDEVRRRYLTPEIQKQVDMQVMIANRIYDLLEQKGMSQKDLAQKLGKTETEVSRWLCGTHNLTMATLAKIAVALDDDLITPTVTKRKRSLLPKLSLPRRAAAVL